MTPLNNSGGNSAMPGNSHSNNAQLRDSHATNAHSLNCDQVLQSMLLFLDHELTDPVATTALTIHFKECPPCNEEMTHEEKVLGTLKSLLSRECSEKAPEDLAANLAEQTAQLAAAMAAQAATESGFGPIPGFIPGASTQITTTYRRTEVTIDGETHVEIETSHEIRHEF